MHVVVVAIGIFALAIGLLSVGVMLKKRTPLRGACHAAPRENKEDRRADEMVCDRCSCGKVALKK